MSRPPDWRMDLAGAVERRAGTAQVYSAITCESMVTGCSQENTNRTPETGAKRGESLLYFHLPFVFGCAGIIQSSNLSRKLNPLSASISNLFLQYMDKNLLRGGAHWFAARGAPALSTGGFATAERESQRTGERE